MTPKFVGSVVRYPARALFLWYLGLILLGTLLLTQPICGTNDVPALTWLEAVFTSSSAACVTGLTVRSTAHEFSWLGQLVILVLIQLGGIGIMTVTTFITLQLGGQARLRERVTMTETLGTRSADDLRWLLFSVLRLVGVCEGLGFLLLFARFVFDMPFLDALWHALFHSVSAFCNAGFALEDNSLTRYQGDLLVIPTVSLLVILGGLGFPVLIDLQRHRKKPWREMWLSFSLHTKLMLIGTAGLLTIGTVTFLLLEQGHSLNGKSAPRQIMIAFFQSVTCRTAGFNSVPLRELSTASIFISILLMAIGTGPCSTGGGFKVSTLMVLLLLAWSRFRGFSRVRIFRRTLPRRVVDQAITTVLLFGVIGTIVLTGVLLASHTESIGGPRDPFLPSLFEVVSALSTVGLSMNLTAELSSGGQFLIILLMFLGRVGPISVLAAISRGRREEYIEYLNEEVLIG